jgi:MFS family permease
MSRTPPPCHSSHHVTSVSLPVGSKTDHRTVPDEFPAVHRICTIDSLSVSKRDPPFYPSAAPTVLERIGFTNTAVSFAATLGLGVISLIATLIALTVIDQAGRKRMLIVGLFVLATSLGAMAVLTLMPQSVATRWGQVACLAVFVAAFGLTLGPICGIVISEIYPQSIRGRATSLASSMQSVFAIVFTLTFPVLLHALGLAVTLVGYAAVGVLGAFYLMRALPETKGKSLEEIAEFWNRHAKARRPAEV